MTMELSVRGIEAVLLVMSSVVFFLYGLDHLGGVARQYATGRFSSWIKAWTNNRWAAFGLGAAVTAVVQSSSAVSALVIAIVEAGVLPLAQALPVLFGANLGTVITTQLVAFQLTFLGPGLVVAGFIAGLLPGMKYVGRLLFYFGFVLFALDLIGDQLRTFADSEGVRVLVLSLENVGMGVLVGVALTALFQSSSVTMGLVVVAVQAGVLPSEAAYAMVLGANIGTTSTGLIAASRMHATAKVAAIGNTLFNVMGVLVFLPIVYFFEAWFSPVIESPAQRVALFHALFNGGTALIFLGVLLKPTVRLLTSLEKILKNAQPERT